MNPTVLERTIEGPQRVEYRPPASTSGWWMWGELVMVQCPNGHGLHLPHAIDARGMVTPSIACPIPGCGWHVFARLDGWAAGEKPRASDTASRDQRLRELGLKDSAS